MNALFDTTSFTTNPRHDLEMAAKQQRGDRLLDKFATAINGQPSYLVGKKPWEMTRSVWKEITAPVTQAYHVSTSIGMAAGDAFLKRYGYDHNGYGFNFPSVSNTRHEVQVVYALMRGDHVPDEVANEYSREFLMTYDLRDFAYLPRYVTAEERYVAIEIWQERKARTELALKTQNYHYKTERELKLELACSIRIMNELAKAGDP